LKKTLTILFGSPHLSYSPTVIGLYDLLSPHFDVTIIAPSPSLFDGQALPNRKVVYSPKIASGVKRVSSRIRFEILSLLRQDIALLKKAVGHHSFLGEYEFIRDYLARENPDVVIAVDFRNLYYTQLLARKAEFLSLEIIPDDKFYANCNLQNVNSVIIQTEERRQHLFNGKQLKSFIIQNAPVFTPPVRKYDRNGLVYCGTAWDAFGFYHYLEFLKSYPEYTLTVKGAVLKDDSVRIQTDYRELLSSRRLVIDDGYLDDAEVVEYLRRFRIGFCFYNFDIDWVNTFNYQSAPSGKLFKYFAAGVPVVGVDAPGLSPVRDFDCGVLIKDLGPASIRVAIDRIESDFEYYSRNCLKAAAHYSLDKTVQPFLDYLLRRTG